MSNLKRGDIVQVMPHSLEGKAWTVGKVGAVIGPMHLADFDVRGIRPDRRHVPPIKDGWYSVSLDHDNKGGYAYASLPDTALAPHSCVEGQCPMNHPCLRG